MCAGECIPRETEVLADRPDDVHAHAWLFLLLRKWPVKYTLPMLGRFLYAPGEKKIR